MTIAEIDMRNISECFGSRTLDLDNLLTLSSYNNLLAISQKCLAHQVDFTVRERVIHAKFKEIMALEAKIMADYATELESLSLHIRDGFAARRRSTLNLRLSRLRTYWDNILSPRLFM